MTSYPIISDDRPSEYTLKTRLSFDNAPVGVVFQKSGGVVKLKHPSHSLGDVQGYYHIPDGGGPTVQGLPELLRVLADDIEYALTELAKPEY